VHEYVGDLTAEAEEEAEVLAPAPAAH
jgi:hypothetical protein